jgi:DNA-binding winged helix-turn-helix (wHTH) protein
METTASFEARPAPLPYSTPGKGKCSREKPRFIQTLPRRGYRFIAPVESVESVRTSIPALGETASSVTRDEASHVELRRHNIASSYIIA